MALFITLNALNSEVQQKLADNNASFAKLVASRVHIESPDSTPAPNLIGTIDYAMGGKELDTDFSPITLISTIRNNGSRTIVDGWGLSILFPFGAEIITGPYLMKGEEKSTFFDPRIGLNMRFYGSESLFERAQTPIETGGAVSGVLMFTTTPAINEAIGAGCVLSLKFRDNTGTYYTAKYDVNNRAPVLRFPGLRSGALMPNTKNP